MKSLLEFMNRDRLKKYKVGSKELDGDLLIEICRDPKSTKYIAKNASCEDTTAQAALTYLDIHIEDFENKAEEKKESFQEYVMWWIPMDFPYIFPIYIQNVYNLRIDFKCAQDVASTIFKLIEEHLKS